MRARTLRRAYMREAFLTLLCVGVLGRIVRSDRLIAWAARAPRRVRRFPSHDLDWVGWAVERIVSKGWIAATPMTQALTAQLMFRRRGIASSLCLGVARKGEGLVTHAWIEVGKKVVFGGVEASGFTRIATFGGSPS